MILQLTDQEAEDLQATISNMLYAWSPHTRASDYCCRFCDQRPPTNGGIIQHKDDCLGLKLLSKMIP